MCFIHESVGYLLVQRVHCMSIIILMCFIKNFMRTKLKGVELEIKLRNHFPL